MNETGYFPDTQAAYGCSAAQAEFHGCIEHETNDGTTIASVGINWG